MHSTVSLAHARVSVNHGVHRDRGRGRSSATASECSCGDRGRHRRGMGDTGDTAVLAAIATQWLQRGLADEGPGSSSGSAVACNTEEKHLYPGLGDDEPRCIAPDVHTVGSGSCRTREVSDHRPPAGGGQPLLPHGAAAPRSTGDTGPDNAGGAAGAHEASPGTDTAGSAHGSLQEWHLLRRLRTSFQLSTRTRSFQRTRLSKLCQSP